MRRLRMGALLLVVTLVLAMLGACGGNDDNDGGRRSGLGVANPNITVSDVTKPEGNSGLTNFSFKVKLSAGANHNVSVKVATANGTATTSGADYVARSRVLIFAPGQTVKSFNVPVKGGTTNESNETFTVNLTSATGGTITDAQGTGTITNDDPAPSTTTT